MHSLISSAFVYYDYILTFPDEGEPRPKPDPLHGADGHFELFLFFYVDVDMRSTIHVEAALQDLDAALHLLPVRDASERALPPRHSTDARHKGACRRTFHFQRQARSDRLSLLAVMRTAAQFLD